MENKAYYFSAYRKKDKLKLYIRCQTNEKNYFQLVDILIDFQFKLLRILMSEWMFYNEHEREIPDTFIVDLLDDEDFEYFVKVVKRRVISDKSKTKKK